MITITTLATTMIGVKKGKLPTSDIILKDYYFVSTALSLIYRILNFTANVGNANGAGKASPAQLLQQFWSRE